MRIAGLSRANKKDIERCYDAVRHAQLSRIHTFLASSDIHLEHKLGISRAECVSISSEMVAFAKTMCDDIEFSPEDVRPMAPPWLGLGLGLGLGFGFGLGFGRGRTPPWPRPG